MARRRSTAAPVATAAAAFDNDDRFSPNERARAHAQ